MRFLPPENRLLNLHSVEIQEKNLYAIFLFCFVLIIGPGGTWLAHSEEHVTLDLLVLGSSPTLDIEININKK